MKSSYAKDKYSVFRWLLLSIIVLTAFLSNINPAIALLIYILPTIFCFFHGARFFGRKNIFIFFVTIFVISYLAEYLGTHTGKIFGQYYYNTIGNGPLLFGVPPLLMLTYFSIAYSSNCIVRVLLKNYQIIKGWLLVGFSMCVALLMTLTDLASDPVNSTINQVYIWTNGGSFFGVPYLNFIGWMAETFIFALIISVVFGYITHSPKLAQKPSKQFLLQPIILFSAPILPIIFRPLWIKQWSDIYQSMSLIALIALGFVITLSTVKIFSDKQ